MPFTQVIEHEVGAAVCDSINHDSSSQSDVRIEYFSAANSAVPTSSTPRGWSKGTVIDVLMRPGARVIT